MGRSKERRQNKGQGRGKDVEDENCKDGECKACGSCYATLESKFETYRGNNDELSKKIEKYMEEEAAWKARAEKVTDERDELDSKLTSEAMAKRKQGEDRWALRHLTGEDAPAQEIINVVMKDCVFPFSKFLARGWELYERDMEDSICSMIMDEVEVPSHTDDQMYWLKIRGPAFYKFCTLKQQARKKIHGAILGKSVHVMIPLDFT